MELFSLDPSDQSNDIKLRVNSELVMFWIHFSSFQLHWRGYEIAENQDREDADRDRMNQELQFFDFLYHKFLMYVPKVQDNETVTFVSLSIQVIEKIYYELDDFIQYCKVYEEDDLLAISKHYKMTFSTLFDSNDSHTYH
jgi:hypothetical protein